ARSETARRPLSAPTRWLFVAASLFALSGGVATLVNQGARTALLSWANGISQQLNKADPTPAANVTSNRQTNPATTGSRATASLPAIPPPDRHGVIHLDSTGPYRASDLTLVGTLAIVGDETATPHIVIGDQPFKLCAESVRLKNVRFVT